MSDAAAPGAGAPEAPLVLVEHDGPVAVLRLNRPEVLNALSTPLVTAIGDALEAVEADPALRCSIITGEGGKAFSAGADIAEFVHAGPVDIALGARMRAWDRLRRITKPLIAAVDGYAMGGGCELAMLCDIALASETAVFGLPETAIGVVPGAGGTQRAIRTLGKPLAMEMILAGRRLRADEALQHGLVTKVLPREELLPEAVRIAQEIAKRSPVAIRLARDAVNQALELPLAGGLELERRAIAVAFGSHDAKEGFTAFLEKRPPEFTGR